MTLGYAGGLTGIKDRRMPERVRRHFADPSGQRRLLNHLAYQPAIHPMDFEAIGFDLGIDLDLEEHRHSPPRPASPPREPLPSARTGFTRSPKEDDVCVCPNCQEELCTGEDEVKRQIFVVKACGHVSLKLVECTHVH